MTTADRVFDIAVKDLFPWILCGDMVCTGVYHDPTTCGPNEVLIYDGVTWNRDDWFTSNLSERLRLHLLDHYCMATKQILKDENMLNQHKIILDAVREIASDTLRLRKDKERMLGVIKDVSPKIIDALAKPNNNVGEMIAEMYQDPESFRVKYGLVQPK